MDDCNKLAMAAHALQGMLAHPRRYKPRDVDAHMHWHDAIATEAFDIADAMARVAVSRGIEG